LKQRGRRCSILQLNLLRVFISKMKWLKYVGAVVSALLIVGTLPSVYFIAKSLVADQVDEPIYFAGKLFAYIAIIVALAFMSAKLFRSARR
jgi:hypothetical protein